MFFLQEERTGNGEKYMRGINTILEKSKEEVQMKDPSKYSLLLLTSAMSRMKVTACFICKNVKIIQGRQ